jgi:hypothetical protein
MGNIKYGGIDDIKAELINDWLVIVDFLPQEVHEYTQESPNTANWEFRQNEDNTIDVIFPNDVVITVDVNLDTEDVSYVSDSLSTIEDKELYGDDFGSNDNVSKPFDQDFKYEHKIITTIKEFKQYLKINESINNFHDLEKTFIKYDFEKDHNIDGLYKRFLNHTIPFELILRYADESDEIYDVTLILNVGGDDDNYIMLEGVDKILNFLDNGLIQILNTHNSEDMDKILDKYEFE